jgi:hypothetical protein
MREAPRYPVRGSQRVTSRSLRFMERLKYPGTLSGKPRIPAQPYLFRLS